VYARSRLLGKLGPPETATLDDVLRVIGTAHAASSRRVYLQVLRNCYRDLLELGLVDHDPTRGIRTPSPPRRQPRPMSDEEVRAVMSLGGRVAAWTLLGCKAGLRASEVVGLTTDDLEWTNRGWMLRVRGKGGVVARIPAHAEVVDLLHSLSGVRGRLWPIRACTMSTAWSKAARSVGVHRRFHDCRHTFASRLFSETGDIYTVSRLMRHANVATTQVYAQPDEARQFAAVVGL
jgi:integrase/recombinase XerD